MSRPRHPDKAIEAALQHAEHAGWRIETSSGHAWGRMFCPRNSRSCRCGRFCITSIWSIPKNADSHARQLRRVVDNCTADSEQDNQE